MNEKKKSLYFLFGISLIILILIFGLVKETPELCIQEKCFNVKIADTAYEREIGLMYVEKLKEDSGMIFVYETSGNYSYWMKNTKIPLDIIWIDENNKIVYIEKNALPCYDECILFNSKVNSKYVLEINSGLCDKYGFDVGDNVWFHLV